MKTEQFWNYNEKASMTMREFFAEFTDDETCLQHLFNVRFGQNYVCPKCNREAKWYRIKAERAFSCQWCGHHIHPTVDTPFEDTRTPLQLWFYAIYLFTTSRHGVPAKELQRQLGVTYKTAWRIGHQIREHMSFVDGENVLSGDVEVDETFIGGKVKGVVGRRAAVQKTIVFGMLQRDGEVMTKVINGLSGKEILPHIDKNVAKGSTIHSDEFNTYRTVKRMGYTHKKVNHSIKQYVKGDCHTNGIENFWKQFKASVKGSHVHISKKYMGNYTKEFEYRFNNRKNPKAMFPALISSFVKPSKKRLA